MDRKLNLVKRGAKNFLSLGKFSYISFLLLFTSQVIVARLMGAKLMGVYYANLSIVSLIEVPVIVRSGELAISTLGRMFHNQDKDFAQVANEIVRYEALLYVYIYLFFSLACFIVSLFVQLNYFILIFMGLVIPIQIGFGVYKGIIALHHDVKKQLQNEFIQNLFSFVSTITLTYFFGLYGLVFSLLINTCSKTLLTRSLCRKIFPEIREAPKTSFHSPHEMFFLNKMSLISLLRNALYNLIQQIDVMVLSLLQGPEAVGCYKVAKTWAGIPVKFLTPLVTYFQPSLIKVGHNNFGKNTRKFIIKTSFINLIFIIFMGFPLVILSRKIIAPFYGNGFLDAIIYLPILTIGISIFYGAIGWYKVWNLTQKNKIESICIYGSISFFIGLLGAFLAPSGAIYMAVTVSLVLTIASVGIFFRVINGR